MNCSGDTSPKLSYLTMKLRETPGTLTPAIPKNPSKPIYRELTEKVVKDFYAICDASCDAASSKTSTPECVSSFQHYRSGFLNAVLTLHRFLSIVFTANNGAQFIVSVMLGENEHPTVYASLRKA